MTWRGGGGGEAEAEAEEEEEEEEGQELRSLGSLPQRVQGRTLDDADMNLLVS
jgi:hypothetical protein